MGGMWHGRRWWCTIEGISEHEGAVGRGGMLELDGALDGQEKWTKGSAKESGFHDNARCSDDGTIELHRARLSC